MNTANLFAAKGHRITLLILDETAESFYPLDPSVRLIQLPLSFGISTEGNIISRKVRMLSDVMRLRKQLRALRPEVILSSEYPFTVAMVLSGARQYARLYAWEHHHFHWLEKNRFWTKACAWAYPRLQAVIVLSEAETKYYADQVPVTVIPNHLEPASGPLASSANKQLLTIGRLIKRKGIDLLLEIAPAILQQNPDWKWKIIGEGEWKDAILECIRKEGLEGRLLLQAPAGHDLKKEYAAASIYVMTSRFEAFPMVLLEAMQQGLPCISFDCPSGPAAIIRHGTDGLLIANGDQAAMTNAINKLLSDENGINEMGAAAFRNIKRYERDEVYRAWEKLLT